MVRNEADIIEAFVRHNLTRLDGLLVVDHGSADDTVRILHALQREGLPLTVLLNTAPGYAQAEIMTVATRQAFASTPAAFVFPLDADEFIKTPSRAAMDHALAAVPPGMHGLMTWHTYVPDFAASGLLAAARGARRMPAERHRHGKAVVGRHFVDDPRAMLASGNHAILPWHGAANEELAAHHLFDPAQLALAHLPIRSGPQLVAKTVIKRLARVAIGRDWSTKFDRYVAYERIRSGATLDAALFTELVVNSQTPHEDWIDPASIALVDDPFLADIALRYTPKENADALPLVLAALENFARLEAKARAAAGTAG